MLIEKVGYIPDSDDNKLVEGNTLKKLVGETNSLF